MISLQECIDDLLSKTVSIDAVREVCPYSSIYSTHIIKSGLEEYNVGIEYGECSGHHYFAMRRKGVNTWTVIPTNIEILEILANHFSEVVDSLIEIRGMLVVKEKEIRAQEKHALNNLQIPSEKIQQLK